MNAKAEMIESVKSAPLAVALLVLNCGFLLFGAWVLGTLAAETAARDRAQVELIEKMVNDIRDCRQAPAK